MTEIRRFKSFLLEALQYIVKTPKESTEEELKDFYDLIVAGGNFTGDLMDRIKDAKLLGFIYEGGELVGTRGIKRPKDSYKNKVFDKAGVSELAREYKYETGYAYTSPKMRKKGLYGKMASHMFKFLKFPTFATTQHKTVINLLKKYGFEQLGEPYKSEIGEHKLILMGRK